MFSNDDVFSVMSNLKVIRLMNDADLSFLSGYH